MKQLLWSAAYRSWPPDPGLLPGYTLLLTVPPDLPVFLRLAVEICRRQDQTGLVETLVIPDAHLPAFRGEFERAATNWPEGRLRLVEPGLRDRVLRPFLRKPSLIHWLQIIAGIARTRSTHAIVHDVDLFMLERGFLRSLFETCRDRDLHCLGNAPPWEGAPWAPLPRFAHVVALWELAFAVPWARSMPPAALRPQKGDFPEGTFWFETSLLAQARTAPERIARHRAADQVHFGWVVGCHREFERTSGPYEDDRFRLLLIRLLTDVFAPDGAAIAIPPHRDLVAGLTDRGRRVYYADAARRNYPVFRAPLGKVLDSELFAPAQREALRSGLQPFDERFATPSP